MKKYKIAAIVMIIHGGFMELAGCLILIPILALGSANVDVGQYFSFIVPYFQNNLNLMIAVGGIFGIIRLIGAIGILKNRMWGLALSIINCCITILLMVFMLPAGILDGVLAGSALILMLTQYYKNKKIY